MAGRGIRNHFAMRFLRLFFALLLLFPGSSFSQMTDQSLAERFAPLIMHPSDEPNWPTNVEWFLSKVHLQFHSDRCKRDVRDFGIANTSLLNSASVASAALQKSSMPPEHAARTAR